MSTSAAFEPVWSVVGWRWHHVTNKALWFKKHQNNTNTNAIRCFSLSCKNEHGVWPTYFCSTPSMSLQIVYCNFSRSVGHKYMVTKRVFWGFGIAHLLKGGTQKEKNGQNVALEQKLFWPDDITRFHLLQLCIAPTESQKTLNNCFHWLGRTASDDLKPYVQSVQCSFKLSNLLWSKWDCWESSILMGTSVVTKPGFYEQHWSMFAQQELH